MSPPDHLRQPFRMTEYLKAVYNFLDPYKGVRNSCDSHSRMIGKLKLMVEVIQ